MLHLVIKQKPSPNFQLVEHGMQGLSLKEQVQEEDLMTQDPNDDPNSNSIMSEFGSETKDDKNLIMHNLELPMEDLMDQGFDDLIRAQALAQMVNLILQQHQHLLKG
jgi:hypothetical protein